MGRVYPSWTELFFMAFKALHILRQLTYSIWLFAFSLQKCLPPSSELSSERHFTWLFTSCNQFWAIIIHISHKCTWWTLTSGFLHSSISLPNIAHDHSKLHPWSTTACSTLQLSPAIRSMETVNGISVQLVFDRNFPFTYRRVQLLTRRKVGNVSWWSNS